MAANTTKARGTKVLACGALLIVNPLFGCGGGRLVPAKSAQSVPGTEHAVFAQEDGLRCAVDSLAWTGRDELPQEVVPVRVRLTNASGAPVRLRYEDFALVGKGDRRYVPLPLVSLEKDPKHLPKVVPLHFSEKFFVAHRLRDAYPTLEAWSQPFERDESLYFEKLAKWGPEGPSREILRQGLPEGIVADGGAVTGFLFFESPSRERRVTFEAQLETGDPSTGERRIDIQIPFRVE
jgi:hypothetical protein